jgi:hypothetical protein
VSLQYFADSGTTPEISKLWGAPPEGAVVLFGMGTKRVVYLRKICIFNKIRARNEIYILVGLVPVLAPIYKQYFVHHQGHV